MFFSVLYLIICKHFADCFTTPHKVSEAKAGSHCVLGWGVQVQHRHQGRMRSGLAAACLCGTLLLAAFVQPCLGRFTDTEPPRRLLGGPDDSSEYELTFTPRTWRVDPTNGLLTLVQPIYPSDFELGQFHNQLRTMSHFFESTSVKEFVLITPTDQLRYLETFLQASTAAALHDTKAHVHA